MTSPVPESAPERDRLDRYWRQTRRLTAALLLLWLAATFGLMFFARELSAVQLFGWPVSFYMASQGAMLIYLFIVVLFARRMRRLDRELQGDRT